MRCKETLDEYLQKEHVEHAFEQHPRAYTAQEVAAAEHVSGNRLAKVVMVVADDDLAMVVVPAPAQVDLEKVRETLDAERTRLAEEDEFAGCFPDCEVGAMPAFGNLYDVRVVVADDLASNDSIVTQAGSHSETVSLRYRDYARLVHPRVADVVLR